MTTGTYSCTFVSATPNSNISWFYYNLSRRSKKITGVRYLSNISDGITITNNKSRTSHLYKTESKIQISSDDVADTGFYGCSVNESVSDHIGNYRKLDFSILNSAAVEIPYFPVDCNYY